ncbi:cation transporter [Rhodococcoides trifolii]|uniref:Cation transporter n=1 Tax=Rhodococcoides trifolii TaxID=908250 RepID=A0A917G3Q6_9NOCA|nr:cation transporter [Rhodococcus trifolii]
MVLRMGHGHAHGHDVGADASTARIRRMGIAWLILVVFFALELTVGLVIDSLGLIADAGHMLTDVLGMTMGLVALTLARRGSNSASRTFGWHRAEVLTAIANAVLLLGVAVWILVEAIGRIGEEPDIPGGVMVAVATAGLVANIVVMMLIRADAKDSIAVRGAYLEVLADAVGSVGVLIAGVLLMIFGWAWVDIVVGVAISVWVVPRAVKLAGQSLRILTQASPSSVDIPALEADLAALPGVVDVHDLHVWTLTTGMDVATVHITCNGSGSVMLDKSRTVLAGYGLAHATVQVEPAAEGKLCKDELTW